jgi:ssDNA-binding Zn-finger/Zn-ribbon topoisomerase 1
MSNHPKESFFPLCDLHHFAMRRVMLEGSETQNSASFHQCERRDCTRIYREGDGYSDFARGQFDASRAIARLCPTCGATLYLAEVDHVRKTETWECAEEGCDYSQEISSPASR